jgi:elongation factor Tu
MIIVIAKIKLYSDEIGRKTPFLSGYRPLFNFIKESKTSGEINLRNKNKMFPNEVAEVEIKFVDKRFLGNNFGVGTRFTFDEGRQLLGEGEILKIINAD